jgi:hypothetical protein
MPCNEVRTVTANLHVADLDALAAAVEQVTGERAVVGSKTVVWSYGGAFANGQLTARNMEEVGAIRREYSAQVFQKQAQKFGWAVKRLPNGQLAAERQRYGR